MGVAGARKMYGLLAQGGFWRKHAQGIPPGVEGCLASDPGIRICSQIFPWNKGYGVVQSIVQDGTTPVSNRNLLNLDVCYGC